MFSSEQKYFSAGLEVFRCFNTNSLELFRTSEVHSTSPMYFALKKLNKKHCKEVIWCVKIFWVTETQSYMGNEKY